MQFFPGFFLDFGGDFPATSYYCTPLLACVPATAPSTQRLCLYRYRYTRALFSPTAAIDVQQHVSIVDGTTAARCWVILVETHGKRLVLAPALTLATTAISFPLCMLFLRVCACACVCRHRLCTMIVFISPVSQIAPKEEASKVV